jgi:hypothetical protein
MDDYKLSSGPAPRFQSGVYLRERRQEEGSHGDDVAKFSH